MNINLEKRILKIDGIRISDDGENFIKLLDEWVEELEENDYWIYSQKNQTTLFSNNKSDYRSL